MGLKGADTKDGVVEISKDPARGGKHGDAAVLKLGFAEEKGPLRGLLGKLQGVEVLELRTLVAWKATSENHFHGAGSHTSFTCKEENRIIRKVEYGV